MAGKHVEHLETVRARKDGTVFPVSITISPVRDEDGAIVGAAGVHRNMTELQHAARYARSLIEAALDPLVTISPEGKITDVNEASVKVTGVPREALIGSDFSQYFTDPDKAREGYARAFAHGSLIDYPLTLVHQDGTLVDALCNASVYRDLNGAVLGGVGGRARRLQAAPAAAAQRAVTGGPGVTDHHRTGQRDHRRAPRGHHRAGLPTHTQARPQPQCQPPGGCPGDR